MHIQTLTTYTIYEVTNTNGLVHNSDCLSAKPSHCYTVVLAAVTSKSKTAAKVFFSPTKSSLFSLQHSFRSIIYGTLWRNHATITQYVAYFKVALCPKVKWDSLQAQWIGTTYYACCKNSSQYREISGSLWNSGGVVWFKTYFQSEPYIWITTNQCQLFLSKSWLIIYVYYRDMYELLSRLQDFQIRS